MKELSAISSIIQTLQEQGYKTPDKMKKKIKVHVDPEEMAATNTVLDEPKDSISESEEYESCVDCGKSIPKKNLSKYKGDLLCPTCVQYWEGPIKPINIKEDLKKLFNNNPFIMIPANIAKGIGSVLKSVMPNSKRKKVTKRKVTKITTIRGKIK